MKTSLKKIKDHIAAALMKLAYISRDEAIRTRNSESFKIADHYFTQVINTLKGNLFPELTENYQEIYHNIIDHYLLANAYLMLGRRGDKNRKLYDLKAISHLILGLRLDQRNSQLIYTLGRPGVKNILREFNIVYGMANDNVARRLVAIESQIVSEIDNLEKL